MENKLEPRLSVGLRGQDRVPGFLVSFSYPKGPCTQQLGTWVLGTSDLNTGFGQVYNY